MLIKFLIWEVPCNSHWMQRAMHTSSLLRKCSAHRLFPEGREGQLLPKLEGWHGNASQIHECSLLCAIQTYPSETQDHSHSFPTALWFCLSFLANRAQQVVINRSHSTWRLQQVEYHGACPGTCPHRWLGRDNRAHPHHIYSWHQRRMRQSAQG